MAETFDEWRVTGEPGHNHPHYSFVWSQDRGDEEPEASARGFLALINSSADKWVTGPFLLRRTVTRTDWEPAPPIPSESRSSP